MPIVTLGHEVFALDPEASGGDPVPVSGGIGVPPSSSTAAPASGHVVNICEEPSFPHQSARTSISLDEPAIRFIIGLAHLAVTAVIVATALQAFIAAQLGLAIGANISERLGERAEQVAGVALILLGGYLIAEQPVR